MLTLRIDPDDPHAWTWDGTRYITGGQAAQPTGHITPYRHPMIEHLAATDGTRTAVIVRERVPGRTAADPGPVQVTPAQLDDITAAAQRWPADHVLVETRPRHPVRVTAGATRVTPLFLAHAGGVLHGSWDMTDLQPLAGALNPKEATRLLIYRPRYSTGTAFAGIHRLTERATATFAGDLFIRYPDPVPHAEPRELAPDADVLAAFTAGIDAALDSRPIDPAATVAHLTGGLDSGSIGSRAARRWPHQLNTATLIIIGPGREQQIRRRAEMLDRLPFGPQDLQVDTLDRLMFGPDCPRMLGELVSPYDEPFYELFTTLNTRIADTGAHTLITGLGGDEMVAVGSAESAQAAADKRQNFDLPWLGERARAAVEYGDDAIAPPALIGGITLLAAETVAPPLLHAGIWPIHPFTHPALIELGDQLPFYWRELKQLQRRHLASFGLSHDACNPTKRESFAELAEESVTINGAPALRRIIAEGSPLIEEGFVNPDGLKAIVDEVETGLYREDLHSKLIEVISLDRAVRAFLP